MVGYAIWVVKCSTTFMRIMNQLFRPYIGKFVVGYFNDMLVNSKSEDEHLNHLT